MAGSSVPSKKICPVCGKGGFTKRPNKNLRVCNACGIVGWKTEDGYLSLGKKGKGNACKICNTQTLQRIYESDSFDIISCSNYCKQCP